MANQPKKYKKFVATAATATLVASAIVPVASAASLTDIAGNTHEGAINALVDSKVISGYPDGTFKPNQTLTRSDVVKLLGKYLVSQGHSIPADAVTNPRFSDLTSKSNKELLEYAAVVADAGVFAGSNGKLLAADQITRENMAIVLVRMINTLKDVSLEEFVGSQNFNGDVKDLNVAKAEARTAIQVLDFYDITNPSVANFNPKGNTTRGQFATFLHKTINTDFAGAAASTGTVKAINATTVEVTFGEDVADVKALDFAINGLEVSNAVVKQTDKKTVVLTTSPQTAGVEYTVSVNGNEFGKFTGISAVIPTKVDLVSTSVQGKLGQQVTVQAKVTVAAGQSAAGIPVTLNATSTNGTLNAPQVVEATTDANGVATYTYTRYAAGNDTVVAYSTGDRSKFSTGYVFWGVDTILAVTEVTEGATINNGANKTYKVTYKNATTGKVEANKVLNVSFLENINVTADKLQNASVNGIPVAQLSNGTAPVAAQVTTDSKGEATFTVSGVNTEVTPVVFEAHNTYTTGNVLVRDFAYEASDLQATASKVKFSAIQAEYTIEIVRDGAETAARFAENGRKYKVVVKDKAGNLAKNELVNVAFNEDLDRVISTTTEAKFVNVAADGSQTYRTGSQEKKITVTTNAKGEASFVISSDKLNDYATPVAWIDVNNPNAKEGNLDEGEPKTVAPISYFVNAYLDGASLKSYRGTTAVTSFNANETAVFKAALVNQSGKTVAGTSIKKVTYTVFNTGASDVTVGTQVISPNRSYTVTYDTPQDTNLYVKPVADKGAAVKVVATGVAIDTDGKDYAFTAQEASATFEGTKAVGTLYTGVIESWDTEEKEIKFVGKDAISYVGEGYVYRGIGNTPIANAAAFIQELEKAAGAVTVTYEVKDGVTTFYIINIAASSASSVLERVNASTSATQVATALNGYAPFEKLTAANKTAVANTIFGLVAAGPITVAQLNAAIEALIVIDVTAAYVAGTTATTGAKATGSYVDATDADFSLEIESKDGGTEYNGVKVVFANNTDTTEDNVTTSYSSNVLTVLLPVDTYNSVTGEVIAYDTNATITNVLAAIDAFNVAGDLTATAGASLTDVEDLLDIEVTLTGATASTAAVAGTLTLTFSEAVTALTNVVVNTGTPATIAGTSRTVSADGKTVVITLSAADETSVSAATAVTTVNATPAVSGQTFKSNVTITK